MASQHSAGILDFSLWRDVRIGLFRSMFSPGARHCPHCTAAPHLVDCCLSCSLEPHKGQARSEFCLLFQNAGKLGLWQTLDIGVVQWWMYKQNTINHRGAHLVKSVMEKSPLLLPPSLLYWKSRLPSLCTWPWPRMLICGCLLLRH